MLLKKIKKIIKNERINVKRDWLIITLQIIGTVATIATVLFLVYNLRQLNTQIDGLEKSLSIMQEQLSLQRGLNDIMEDLVLSLSKNVDLELKKYREEKERYINEHRPELDISRSECKIEKGNIRLDITYQNKGKSTASDITAIFDIKELIANNSVYSDTDYVSDLVSQKRIVKTIYVPLSDLIFDIDLHWKWDFTNEYYSKEQRRYIRFDAEDSTCSCKLDASFREP